MSVASRVVELFEMRGWGLYRTSNEIVMDIEYLNGDYVQKMIHEVIRRLENFVFA